jgi:transcriptional regulator NrdR family protein
MNCPQCDGLSRVITSRPVLDIHGGRLRRRVCTRCPARWYSLQPEQPAEVAIPAHAVSWKASDVIIHRDKL